MHSVNHLNDVPESEQSGSDDVFVFPPSFAQQRLWFLDKLEPGQSVYNVPLAIRLSGNLNIPVLQQALRELVARHEVLRTTFSEDELGKPQQLVAAEQGFTLTVTNLTQAPVDSREAEVRRAVIEQARAPFELKRGPLFRINLFCLSETDHVLSLVFHHIVFDGWSSSIVLRELWALYEAFLQGKPSPLAPLPIQYGDYATWQRQSLQGEHLDKLVSYWKNKLRGAPALLDLPADFPRPALQTFPGAHETVVIPKSVEEALVDLSKKESATLFMTLLAAFGVLLSRYSGQDEVVIGSPISGRTRSELEQLIGFFVNTLPLRCDLSGDPSFRDIVRRVRETSLLAYAHQELPFEKLVEELNPERNLSHNPIFQVVLTFDSDGGRQRAQIASLATSPFRAAEGMTAKFDLSLNAVHAKQGLTLGITYNTDLFRAETIERMARAFSALLAAIAEDADRRISDFPLLEDALEVIPRTRPLQLSYAQQRLWLLDRLDPRNPLYNLPLVLRLKGPVQPRAMRNALNRIVARHESLRTWFMSRAGTPVQMITPFLEVDLVITSLMGVPERVRKTEARRVVLEEVNCPFDLAVGPLVRAKVVKLSEIDHVLVVNTHQIISDPDSLRILRNELIDFYEQELRSEVHEAPPLPVQYADYAAWQRQLLSGGSLHGQLRYWKRKLAGAPATLDLPTERPRPAEQTFRGATYELEVPRSVSDKFLAVGHRDHVPAFATLLSAFYVLLARYSGQDDIVVGTPVAGRPRPELERLIGFFSNALVLRTEVDGTRSFRQLLATVRETVAEAHANPDVPFEKVVEELKPERDLSRHPLFQVMFALENAGAGQQSGGALELSDFAVPGSKSKFDLTLRAHENNSGLHLKFEYNIDLFNEASMRRMADHFVNLISAIAADPEQNVGLLPMLSEAERHEILNSTSTAQKVADQNCVCDLVRLQAQRAPNQPAVICDGEQMSYEQLERRSNQLAQLLRGKGVGPEIPVGLCMPRSAEYVVSALAILKAGGVYVPIDPGYPQNRISMMLEDCAAPVVLTTASLVELIPPGNWQTILVTESTFAGHPDSAFESLVKPENLAYIVFTSGSTGRPKGVQVTHGNLLNLVAWHRRVFEVTASDRATLHASPGFDAAVWELWPYLASGASVYVVDEGVRTTPEPLRDWLVAHGITISFLATPIAELMIQLEWPAETTLRFLLTGGDTLRRYPSPNLPFALVNNYGPTECTVLATSNVVTAADRRLELPSIGKAIDNLQVYIVDEHLQLVGTGVVGELVIGGAGVARGYLNLPEATREKFVPDPFSRSANARLYRTGDRARRLPGGDIQFLGRIDQQVKVRGFRIELGEIENALEKHPAVTHSAVTVHNFAGESRLAAYVVTRPGATATSSDLKSHLSQLLPSYMVPVAFTFLGELPLTANGKVDRKALARPDESEALVPKVVAPRDPVEEKLLAIWKRVLQNQSMGVTDNFFDLGGHSLLAAQLVSEMEKVFERKIPLAALFRGATVEEMARVLREGTESAADPIVMQIQAGSTVPFFAVVAPGMDSIGYAALAQAMGPNQTLYKLQSHREVKPGSPITLDEMRLIARDYVQALKTVQPSGPYYLGGMCAGTHIGEQMILQLEAEGKKVALFAIFDTWVRQNSHVRWKWQIHYYHQRLRALRRLNNRGKVKIIQDALSKKLHRMATLQKPVQTSWMKLYWPGKDFQTPHFDAPITLFKRPRQPFYYIKDETMGWSERSRGGVHIHRIDFPHRMLREPYVRDLAKHLLERLAIAQATSEEKVRLRVEVNEQAQSHEHVEA